MRHALKNIWHSIATPENVWAFLLFLIVIALIVFTTDSSPAWIYQGF
jgi:amino acid permease